MICLVENEMQRTTDRFAIAASIRSHTDKDGSTILSIQQDKIYSLIGVGSIIWEWLASSRQGLTSVEISDLLSAQFGEVPRQRIEADAKQLLTSFRDHGIIVVTGKTGRFTRSIACAVRGGFLFLGFGALGLVLMLRGAS